MQMISLDGIFSWFLSALLSFTNVTATTPTPQPETIIESDTSIVRVATSPDFQPYEYYDENNNLVGIDVEIAEAIAQELGKDIEFKTMHFDALFSAIQLGKADIAIAGIVRTEERAAEPIIFSDSYTTNEQVIVVKSDSSITFDSVTGLIDKKIGAVKSSSEYLYIHTVYGADNISRYATAKEAIMAVSEGIVDLAVIEGNLAKSLCNDKPDLKILEKPFVSENYHIIAGENDTVLMDDINAAIKTLKENGKIDEIVAKYNTID